MTNYDYEWENQFNNQTPRNNINDYKSNFGYKIITRNEDKTAKKVMFQLLIDNPNIEVFIVGKFNNWKESKEFKLINDDIDLFASIELENIKHKDKYKYLIKEKIKSYFIEDPAGTYFDDEGNAIFWDYDDPTSYKMKYNFINNFSRSIKIIQTDLPGLVSNYIPNFKQKECYRQIVESGVIKKIKELGFNTIQFLPFAQNIDGDNWKFRYLVPFQFAIQKNWGNPDDFAQMIDEFHKEGISVIGDFVLGHIPHKDFQIFGQSFKEHGIHLWKRKDNNYLYLKEETSWGTIRINFDHYHVRDFFISSVMHFMKHYKIDGFRIDNVDGIIRYGINGDGKERENGRTFLRELNSKIYSYNPNAMINYEAHYYYNDNAKMLVNPMNNDNRALGATAYNSSRLTYYFHTEYMFKSAHEITVWKFKHINDEKEWGKSNSTVADFHNHDAAAGLMPMRCTGSYAIDALSKLCPYFHAIGKIKVMESLISFITEGRTLDLLQTFLLQKGTFEHESAIDWSLLNSNSLLEYKKDVNKIMDNEAFWVVNTKYRHYLNLDDSNKIIVLERASEAEKYIIIINLGAQNLHNYKIGLRDIENFKLVFNSDKKIYLGEGYDNYPETFENRKSNNFELLDREIEINLIKPYQTIILKKIN